MSHKPSARGRYALIAFVLLVSAVSIAYAVMRKDKQSIHADGSLIYFDVKRTDLPLVVTERGNLESQLETEIVCEVENTTRGSSSYSGTQVIFIVPNGSAVKEGELVVELDSAALRDEVDEQVLDVQSAVSTNLQAKAKFDNQIIQNETLEEEAKLAVKLAELELQMYMDKKDGTFHLDMEAIERQIDEANDEILEARAALELQKTEKSGIEELFKLGYRGKSDVDQSHFKFIQAEDRLGASTNKLQSLQASRRKLENYEFQMQTLKLEGAVASAKRDLLRVKNTNKSLLSQVTAASNEADQKEEKERERLTKLQEQVELCKLYAPHDGMIVYAEASRYTGEIREGGLVRQRQKILSLPNLSRMQVKTQIHEGSLDQVKLGLKATVRVGAYNDLVYEGTIEKVAVVPESTSWYNAAVKTYETIVRIDGDVSGVKPGMTAVVDIHIDHMEDILAVPVTAVVQVKKDAWCYVETSGGIEERPLQLGESNDKFVHVTSGLFAEDRVILNPMTLVDDMPASKKAIEAEANPDPSPVAGRKDAEPTRKISVSNLPDRKTS